MMEVLMILSYSKWCIWWLRSNFGCSLRTCVLLKLLSGYLVLTRSIDRMFVVWGVGTNPLVKLMSSNMGAWSSIVMWGMLINSMILIVLWNRFGSWTWSWRTIYIILVLIILMRLLFLAKRTTMTCWLCIS